MKSSVSCIKIYPVQNPFEMKSIISYKLMAQILVDEIRLIQLEMSNKDEVNR